MLTGEIGLFYNTTWWSNLVQNSIKSQVIMSISTFESNFASPSRQNCTSKSRCRPDNTIFLSNFISNSTHWHAENVTAFDCGWRSQFLYELCFKCIFFRASALTPVLIWRNWVVPSVLWSQLKSSDSIALPAPQRCVREHKKGGKRKHWNTKRNKGNMKMIHNTQPALGTSFQQ